ncbi:hypothetical protein OsI_35514 [Oryza sativa Indica Group]|uniref:Protein kinase domain-containing protein n=1 Tax=Oryza sativa subsp. indica TaxID=39946 RepID=B8BJP2_ORYSI|nr:hypothetical protein OsI_35514 [Oryza sativa Indica Group]
MASPDFPVRPGGGEAAAEGEGERMAVARLAARTHKPGHRHQAPDSTMDPTDITFRLLEEITDGFSEERKIGQGAYGTVYKGEFRNGKEIAVKMLHNDTLGFDDKQFENEFQNLMRLEHPNIVRLVAYCYETQHKYAEYKGRIVFAAIIHRALCFEYLTGGSLENHLSDEFHGLDWPTRFKIIKGTCEGLKYLHEGLKPPIYHLDLKPGNILLDKNMVPKLADFGLSKLFTEEKTRVTQTPIGTVGYLPPEYIEKNVLSNKLDIFSLGVVMLNVIAGPRGRSRSAEMSSQEFTDLVLGNWTVRLQATWNGSSLEAYRQQVKTCTEIALKCVEIDRHKRPNILDIVNKINETETMIGKLPISHGSEVRFVNDHREKPTSYRDEFITLESRLASHLNLSDTQVYQEAYHHNGSSFKEKEEDREVHQIIPMENPDIPIDAHPTEPWILTGNIFGSVDILNCDTQFAYASEIHSSAAKLIARKQWLVVGYHDGFIRVYTYESPVQQVKRFKAHSWNITCLDVHPTEPYVLSVGLLDPIKMWDWNKGWECIRMFDMQGSNDETVRLWNSITFKLEGVLDFELGKVGAIVCLKGSKRVVIGHQAGLVITEIRNEQPGPSNRRPIEQCGEET